MTNFRSKKMRCSICDVKLKPHEIEQELVYGKLKWKPCRSCREHAERSKEEYLEELFFGTRKHKQ